LLLGYEHLLHHDDRRAAMVVSMILAAPVPRKVWWMAW
jgi:hypothetical protein